MLSVTEISANSLIIIIVIITHTHPFNGPLSRNTWVSWYQKCKTNLDFTEARDSEWQWHQLGHMQVCTSLQTDNHASTPALSFTGRMLFLPPNQQRQSTEGLIIIRRRRIKIIICLAFVLASSVGYKAQAVGAIRPCEVH